MIAVDLSAERLAEFAATLEGPDVTTVVGDITSQDSIEEIVAAAGGTVHGLANVAGINDDFSPLHETRDAMWEKVLEVNLAGTLMLTRAVLPVMLESAAGAIVSVASEAAEPVGRRSHPIHTSASSSADRTRCSARGPWWATMISSTPVCSANSVTLSRTTSGVPTAL